MRGRGLERYAPLAGVAFVVLVILAAIIGGSTPDNNDSLAKTANFWKDHRNAQLWSSVIAAWALLFFVWFAGTLRSALRAAEGGASRLSAVNFGGALIGATGLLMLIAFSFATADSVKDVSPQVTKTLTVLSNDAFMPAAAGFGLFFISAGVLAVRTRVLPAWLGWVTLLIGIACVTPAGFFALLIGLIWIVAVSVVLFRRGPVGAETAPQASAPVAA